jgi:hypothetical protein
MSKVKVYAPNTAYNGEVGGVQFRNGVGEADEAEHARALKYFGRAGYGVGEVPTPAEPAPQVDARQSAEPIPVGTPLRDAAVDPQPEDYLAPINAGQADPHGPEVVAPQIHADGPKGIRPGDVLVTDPAGQEQREKALAQAVLIEQQDKTEAVPAAETPLDTSPEAQAARGQGPEQGAPALLEQPSRGGSKASWVDYAVQAGANREEAEDMSRDQLAEKYGKPTE